MIPRQGKTRGEIMWDAITLIDKLVDKRALLLGCGVTLPAVWGRMDYSRVSSDASPWWDHSLLRIANVRERVATYNALVSTLNRWPMNNIMFGNDPDVFFIRSHNNKLTADERYTLVIINHLLGRMALMSDNVALYTQAEHVLYSSTFPKAQITMERMDRISSDVYRLHYLSNGRPYITITNLSPLPYRFLLPQQTKGATDNYVEYGNVLLVKSANGPPPVVWVTTQTPLVIRPHQTRTFMRIVDDFAGSTGHILPGWEIECIEYHDDATRIRLRQPRVQSQEIHFYLKDSIHHRNIFIDNEKVEKIQPVNNPALPFPLIQLTWSH
ncbi:hypothetical protein BC941DRAFT_18703 [Chlamydoabsidia padenii]|nr:hypothetical protein BC941DRAFT_18703 [Chlamydoabsidia padenii]